MFGGSSFDLRRAAMAGHSGSTAITRKGCVHDMFKGLLVPPKAGNLTFIEKPISPFFKRLGFAQNGSTEHGDLYFIIEQLDPNIPYVSGDLLARRVQEYIRSLNDPGHASDLTKDGLLSEMTYPASENADQDYRKLLGHDFSFWLLASAYYVVQWCSHAENVGADRAQEFLSQVNENGLKTLLEKTVGSFGPLQPEATGRYQKYIEYLQANVGKPVDWAIVTKSLPPYSNDHALKLLTIQNALGEYVISDSADDLAKQVPHWIDSSATI